MITDTLLSMAAALDAQRAAPKEQQYWAQTYSGETFYYAADKIAGNVYSLEDIAHQTSTITRYGGAAIYPYWVSQHEVALAHAVWRDTSDPVLTLDALFHDAEEGYTGDLRTPIKDQCPEFRRLAAPITTAIRKSMREQGIPVPMVESDIVRVYDRRIVADEKAMVVRPAKQPWYGLEGFGALGVEPQLFAEIDWRRARSTWLSHVHTFAALARQAEAI